MKNKRADIPVAILVLGVVAVCALALLSFFSSSFKLEKSFIEISSMEETNAKMEEYNFYKTKGVSEERIKEALDIQQDGQGKYFLVEQNKIWVRYNLP